MPALRASRCESVLLHSHTRMTHAERISYDREFIEAFVAKFSASPPVEVRRDRPVTKQALVTLVRSTIDQWREDGYSLGAIARHFADLGIAMPLSTLRSCLRRSHPAVAHSRRPRRSARARSAQLDSVPMKPVGLERPELEREQRSAPKNTGAASEGPAAKAGPAVSHRAHLGPRPASVKGPRPQPDAPPHQDTARSGPTTTQQADEPLPNADGRSALPFTTAPDAPGTRSLRNEIGPPVVSASTIPALPREASDLATASSSGDAPSTLLQRARAAPVNLAIIGFTPARNDFF